MNAKTNSHGHSLNSVVLRLAVALLCAQTVSAATIKGSEIVESIKGFARDSLTLPLSKTKLQTNFDLYMGLVSNLASAQIINDLTNAPEAAVLNVIRAGFSQGSHVQDLLEIYGHPVAGLWRAPFSPFPKTQHLTESYRPAWELLLLAPMNEELRLMNAGNTVETALSLIGNTNSVDALEASFYLSCQKEVDQSDTGLAVRKQFVVISKLKAWPSENTFNVVLRSMRLKDELERDLQRAPARFQGMDLQGMVVHALTDTSERRERWKRILGSYDEKGLQVKERDIISRVLNHP